MSIPTTNITTSMVAQALGVGSHSVRELCTSNQINLFAKYKPVPLYSNTTTGINDWWKNGNCGISYPTYSTIADLKAAYNSTILWSHNHPTGGSSSPYRLGDFRGYNHQAQFQINAWEVPSTVYSGAETISCSIGMRQQATDELTIADICGDYYFGALLQSPSGYMYLITSATKIKELTDVNQSFLIPLQTGNSNYTIYPVICTVGNISSSDQYEIVNRGGSLIPIHGLQSKSVTVIIPYYINANASWNGNGQIDYSFTLVNNYPYPVTFSNVRVDLALDDNTNPYFQQDVTVGANTIFTHSASIYRNHNAGFNYDMTISSTSPALSTTIDL